jgi:hypothetical protein
VDYDLKKYIGRAYESYNCLDLVKEFYLDFFGLEVKNYFEGAVPSRSEVSCLINTNRGDFVEVKNIKDIQFGDIVVIRLYGIECHLGVVIHGTKFLHSAKNIGSNMDRLERYARLIAGYYRHRDREVAT